MDAVPIAEAARRLGISADEVWDRVRGGELQAQQVFTADWIGMGVLLPEESDQGDGDLPPETPQATTEGLATNVQEPATQPEHSRSADIQAPIETPPEAATPWPTIQTPSEPLTPQEPAPAQPRDAQPTIDTPPRPQTPFTPPEPVTPPTPTPAQPQDAQPTIDRPPQSQTPFTPPEPVTPPAPGPAQPQDAQRRFRT